MHVVRENHPGIDMKRGAALGVADGGPQGLYVLNEQVAPAVIEINREEVRPARHAVAPVVGHFGWVILAIFVVFCKVGARAGFIRATLPGTMRFAALSTSYALMSVFKYMAAFFHSHLRAPNIYGCVWAEARL